ncbi:MAG: diguanylate cyclase [Chloroflexi bacterium]|nr:diguanylate cyclase [Chloroflexota bacterium]
MFMIIILIESITILLIFPGLSSPPLCTTPLPGTCGPGMSCVSIARGEFYDWISHGLYRTSLPHPAGSLYRSVGYQKPFYTYNYPVPANILVVDDDPIQRELLNSVLNKVGFRVTTLDDSHRVLEILGEGDIQLLITDWMMPGLDGLALTRLIRSAGFPKYVYIILLTGRSDTRDVVKGLEAGADDFLAKPFDHNELIARLSVGRRIIGLEENLRSTRDELEKLATHDHLTLLLNRRAISAALNVELARARRSFLPLSIIFLDLDKFKNINDRHGHATGDKALTEVARVLASSMRPYDFAGRWAGDEFISIIPTADVEQTRKIANRILNRISKIEIPTKAGNLLKLKASIGFCTFKPGLNHVLDLDVLVQQADNAMYIAKSAGGNRVCYLSIEDPGDGGGK